MFLHSAGLRQHFVDDEPWKDSREDPDGYVVGQLAAGTACTRNIARHSQIIVTVSIPLQHVRSQSPSDRDSFSRSKPTTTSSPSITVTGVVIVPMRSSSAIASLSSAMFRVVNSTPCSLRNFSVVPQNSQSGWT